MGVVAERWDCIRLLTFRSAPLLHLFDLERITYMGLLRCVERRLSTASVLVFGSNTLVFYCNRLTCQRASQETRQPIINHSNHQHNIFLSRVHDGCEAVSEFLPSRIGASAGSCCVQISVLGVRLARVRHHRGDHLPDRGPVRQQSSGSDWPPVHLPDRGPVR